MVAEGLDMLPSLADLILGKLECFCDTDNIGDVLGAGPQAKFMASHRLT